MSFLLFLVVGLYLPGRLFFHTLKIKLDTLPSFFLPFGIGILLFTLLSYLTALIHLPILLLPLCIVASAISLLRQKVVKPSLAKEHILPLLTTGVLSLIFVSSTFYTGVFPSGGSGQVLFYRHDDLWHFMLIHELLTTFPPFNPGFSQIPMHGYHFFYDFMLAFASKSFFISPYSLYLRFAPLLLAYLWGMGVYSFAYTWSKKISVTLWSVFLTMFGGSFAFGLLLQNHPGFSLDSGLGMAQPASSLMNPPFTISLALLLTGLFALYYYYQTRKFVWLVPFVLVVGLLPMFKVYAGILLMASYGLLVLVELFRRNFKILLTIPFVALLFFSTYWYFAAGAGFLIWFPLWSPHTILQSFPWYHFDNKVYVYAQEHVMKGLLNLEIDGLMIFFFGNIGTRCIGLLLVLFFILQKKIRPSLFTLHCILLALIAVGIPLFFIQSGKVFEIIQMSWYYLFFVSIFASFGIGFLLQEKFSRLLKMLFIAVFILLTLPSAWETYKGAPEVLTFTPQTNPATTFLTKDPLYTHTVLELPVENTLKDVHSWYMRQLPTVVTFGNKNGYVANEFIDFQGVPINERLQSLADILAFTVNPTSEKAKDMEQFLRENQITYIYSPIERNNLLLISGVKEVFHDKSASIYQFSY